MRKLVAIPVLILALSACGSDSSSVMEPDVTLPSGSMSARIDGTAWQATAALAVSYTGGILAFAGSDASQTTIGMGLIPTAPGTYPIGQSIPTNATLNFGASGSWAASSQQGSGSITLTSFTQNRATGTFQFNMPPVATTGATGTRVVTQGTFDVKF